MTYEQMAAIEGYVCIGAVVVFLFVVIVMPLWEMHKRGAGGHMDNPEEPRGPM